MLPVCLQVLGRVILNGKISDRYYRKSRNRYGTHILLYAIEGLAPEAAMGQYTRIADQILTLTEMPERI